MIRCWICGTDLREDAECCVICGNLRPGNPPSDEEMRQIRLELERRRARPEALRQAYMGEFPVVENPSE